MKTNDIAKIANKIKVKAAIGSIPAVAPLSSGIDTTQFSQPVISQTTNPVTPMPTVDIAQTPITQNQMLQQSFGKVAQSMMAQNAVTQSATTEGMKYTTGRGRYFDAKLGQYGKGNVDLHARPQYKNKDGSTSTVLSMSFSVGKGKNKREVLVPCIWYKNGKPYKGTAKEAKQHYYETGEYLGKFKSVNAANIYADKLHIAQQYYYTDPERHTRT
jgi:hypothetical protein